MDQRTHPGAAAAWAIWVAPSAWTSSKVLTFLEQDAGEVDHLLVAPATACVTTPHTLTSL